MHYTMYKHIYAYLTYTVQTSNRQCTVQVSEQDLQKLNDLSLVSQWWNLLTKLQYDSLAQISTTENMINYSHVVYWRQTIIVHYSDRYTLTNPNRSSVNSTSFTILGIPTSFIGGLNITSASSTSLRGHFMTTGWWLWIHTHQIHFQSRQVVLANILK